MSNEELEGMLRRQRYQGELQEVLGKRHDLIEDRQKRLEDEMLSLRRQMNSAVTALSSLLAALEQRVRDEALRAVWNRATALGVFALVALALVFLFR